MLDFEETEVLRTEFCMHPDTTRETSPVTGKRQYYFSDKKRQQRLMFSFVST